VRLPYLLEQVLTERLVKSNGIRQIGARFVRPSMAGRECSERSPGWLADGEHPLPYGGGEATGG